MASVSMRFLVLFLFTSSLIFNSFGADIQAGWMIGWGDNLGGQVRGTAHAGVAVGLVMVNGEMLSDVTAIAAEDTRSYALKQNGEIVGWGLGESMGAFDQLSNVLAIAAGPSCCLALNHDGTIFGAGYNPDGEATGVATHRPPYWSSGLVQVDRQVASNIVAIALGNGHGLAIKKDGTLCSWGRMKKTPLQATNIVAIAAGRSFLAHDLALRQDGTVLEWSTHTSEVFVHPELTNIVAIAAGSFHYLALKKDGTVKAWGYNDFGQTNVPAGLSNVVAIAAGNLHSMALKKDGTVVAWGAERWHQTDVPAGISNVVAIAAGKGYCLAITTNSAVAESFQTK